MKTFVTTKNPMLFWSQPDRVLTLDNIFSNCLEHEYHTWRATQTQTQTLAHNHTNSIAKYTLIAKIILYFNERNLNEVCDTEFDKPISVNSVIIIPIRKARGTI